MAKTTRTTHAEKGNAMTFEEKMGRLEEIVRILEAGDRPLEESMALFEEGVRLSNECKDVLEKTEKKITVLLSKQENEIPFSEEGKPDHGENGHFSET